MMESAAANKRRYTNIMVEGRQQGGNDEQRTEGRGHESTGTGAVMTRKETTGNKRTTNETTGTEPTGRKQPEMTRTGTGMSGKEQKVKEREGK
jgi:hypothetical protein